MIIPRAPKLPSDLETLAAADPVELTLAFFGRRRVERAKAASADEGATQLDLG